MELNRSQKRILVVLTLINFINYVDRQVIFPLFHLIKKDFGVSDFQLGLLGTTFMVVHSLMSLPLGMLADRYSRRIIIACGVLFWSLASFAGGLAKNFNSLLGIRSAVGIGEASYAPAATSMISDNFPNAFRSRVQGIFNAGMFIGGTFGVVVSGLVAYYFNDWRPAFFLVAIPGFALAALALAVDDSGEHKKHSDWELKKRFLKTIFTNPAYVWISIGGTILTFAAGIYISWGVEFVIRYKNYDLQQASILLGFIFMAAAVSGVFWGSHIADKLQRKIAWGRSALVALSLIASAPVMFLGLLATKTNYLFLLLFFLGTMLLSFYNGPITALIHDVIPKQVWSTAFAAYTMVVHLLGGSIAPAVAGMISDRFSLMAAMYVATAIVFVSGLTFLYVTKLIKDKKVHIYNED